MCSNSGLSSGSNGHNEDSVAHHGRVIYSKKPKRSRVPKRGPGVAELEKILREQENKSDLFHSNNEGFSLFSSFTNSPLHIPSLKSPSEPDQLSASVLERFIPSKIAVTNKKSVQIAGSQMLLPEHKLLPTMWGSSEYSINPMEVPKSFLGTNQQFSSPYIMPTVQYSPPSIVDVFSHIAVSSTATSSTASRLRDSSTQQTSNQASYPHFDSFLPDEDKDVKESQEAFLKRTASVDQSVEKKPVCSFLHKNDRTNFNLNDEADDAEEDAIDLNLKL